MAIDEVPGSWSHTSYAQRILFGDGTVGQVATLLRDMGVRAVMVVTTPRRWDSDEGRTVRRQLGRLLVSEYAEAEPHVPTPALEAAVRRARRDAIDGIVSLGGGSCIDLAKAVTWFTEQEAGTPGASYADRPVLPHVAIPTTYSGAELTPFFGMTDPRTRQKSGGGGPTLAPLAVVYDPDLTRGVPDRVRAETGMNALAHCIEAAWSPTRTPEAEAVALAGIQRIATALPTVVDDVEDREGREGMFAGAFLGGRAMQNATMGAHHGLAQLLGGRTGIPHGLAHAVILPHAMRFTADAVPAEMQSIETALGGVPDGADEVVDLTSRLGLPQRLSECGVDEDDLDAVARLSQSSPPVRAHPRPVGEADARAILAAAF